MQRLSKEITDILLFNVRSKKISLVKLGRVQNYSEKFLLRGRRLIKAYGEIVKETLFNEESLSIAKDVLENQVGVEILEKIPLVSYAVSW